MNAIAQLVRATVGGAVRDLGTLWLRSLALRGVLIGLALLAVIAAAALLIVSGHTALARAIGPLYANIVVAAVLAAIAGGLIFASRIVRRRAEARRRQAISNVGMLLGVVRAAAGNAASRNALAIVATALVAGFLFGSGSGDSDEDE